MTAQNTAQSTEPNSAQTRQEKLPQTASPLPLIALIGLFSIAGIMILRKVRSSSSL